jgi:hypothetical protein
MLKFDNVSVKDCPWMFWQSVMLNDNCIGHICKNMNLADADNFYFCAYAHVGVGRIEYDMRYSGSFSALKDAQEKARRFAATKTLVAV